MGLCIAMEAIDDIANRLFFPCARRQGASRRDRADLRNRSVLGDADPVNGRRMRNYQLDVAYVHVDGDWTGAFLGAVLAVLDEPLAREVLQLAQLRVQRIESEGLGAPGRPQHLLHVRDMPIDTRGSKCMSDSDKLLNLKEKIISVAPMMDWTDRHCRYFHRLLSRHALLYTEMVTTGALIHGDVPRHLRFNAEEHPVALQLGGSEPADLAHCAKLGEEWGYDEINLNCGCPSERVQRGAFGACLMAEPALVADCVKAMVDVTSLPVTVKHRIGIDKIESYDFVRDFVGAVSEAGCGTFIVHARNAWLQGLSPGSGPATRHCARER